MASSSKEVVHTNGSQSAVTSQFDEVMEKVNRLQREARIVTTPEALEALEREIRELTDRLASLLLEQSVQTSLDSEEMGQREKNW